MPIDPDRPGLPPPAPPTTPEQAASHVQHELSRTVAQLIPGAVERAPDPNTAVGLHWRIFDVTSNWLILVLAIVNLALVFFDYTYVDLRHVYQQNGWTQLVEGYDRIKGIEPHRVTDDYVRSAEQAFRAVEAAPDDPATQAALDGMVAKTKAMLAEDPFLTAGLRGVSEQVKNRIRKHVWLKEVSPDEAMRWSRALSKERVEATLTLHEKPWESLSATRSWTAFWSADNLRDKLREEELWFKAEIRPLMERNYWQTYGEDGRPNDNFWIIDCFFLPIFLGEFMIRGIVGVRRGVYASFREFFATRWYDAVYFLPVILYALPPSLQGPLHLVRVISVGARMERLGLINPVAIVQARVAKILDMVTDIVNVKLLSNYQDGVRRFDLEESMSTLTPAQRAQLATLIGKNLSMVVGKVVPDILDEAERLITRSAAQALENAPAYKQFKQLPFFGSLPEQLIGRIVTETIAQMQLQMLKSVSDPENVRLTKELIQAITESLLRHMAEVGTEEQVKAMVVDVLEEQKKRILTD
jgi:hypothetical protein